MASRTTTTVGPALLFPAIWLWSKRLSWPYSCTQLSDWVRSGLLKPSITTPVTRLSVARALLDSRNDTTESVGDQPSRNTRLDTVRWRPASRRLDCPVSTTWPGVCAVSVIGAAAVPSPLNSTWKSAHSPSARVTTSPGRNAAAAVAYSAGVWTR